MEAIYRDYAPRGVQFFYIYKALAHPETNGYVTPYSLQERLMHVKEAQEKLGSEIPWLCDGMDNAAKHALGDAPNSEFLIDPDGMIVRRRQWSQPDQLRRDLEELVGPVPNPTRAEDLRLPSLAPPAVAPRGVVPRVKFSERMEPLVVRPAASEEPFYVKLRVEANPTLRASGSGTLYLGFHCDPLYQVHWNNLAPPMRFRLELPEGTSAQPREAEGPKVEVPADADPREFLVQIQNWKSQPIKLHVDYFACNDEQGWCKQIHQEYELVLQADRDGGTVRRPMPRSRPDGNMRPGPLPPLPGQPIPGRPGPPMRPGTRTPLPGVIVEIDLNGNQVQLDTPQGKRTLPVDPNAQIMRDGRRVLLRDLKPGDRVLVALVTDADQNTQIMAIRARSANIP